MLKNSKYVYGPRDIVVPAELNFPEFLLDKFKKYRNKTAIIDECRNTSVTYGQLSQEVVNLAISLARLGVRKGEVVGVCSENRLEVWSAVVGVICAGAVLTPLNIGHSKGELTHALNTLKPAYIIISQSGFKTHESTFKCHHFIKKIITFGDERIPHTIPFNSLIKNNVNIEDFKVPDVQGLTDTVFILSSSGTSGLPKGVKLTHMNLLATVLLPVLRIPESGEVVWLNITPWYHAMGLVAFLFHLSIGVKVVTLSRFEVSLYMKTIEKYKVTRLTVVPAMLATLANYEASHDLSSVKIIICGAAAMSAKLESSVKTRFPRLKAILQGYGMTENTMVISRDLGHGLAQRPGSVGLVVSGCVVKITDLESGQPLGPRQQGEICIKSVTLMKGYVGLDTNNCFDNEGFFRTGDVGYYDEDGYLYIVGRKKELIKYKGNQVAPTEVEAVLLQHEAVADAGVVGLPHATSGEVPLAFVVKQPGSRVTGKELKDFVAERLSNPKHLRGGVYFIDKIPKNATGKILRKQLTLLTNAIVRGSKL